MKRHFTSFQNMFSIMFVSCTFVLKYSFNTVVINIYYNMLQCQKHSAMQVRLKDLSYNLFYLEDRYFPLLGIFKYFHQQKRVNWFNKLSYSNEYISGLHYFFELAILTLSATLQAGDLIDQVDRDRGANRNQSRGIQLIHAKQLTHHPNTRYILLVMDSC